VAYASAPTYRPADGLSERVPVLTGRDWITRAPPERARAFRHVTRDTTDLL